MNSTGKQHVKLSFVGQNTKHQIVPSKMLHTPSLGWEPCLTIHLLVAVCLQQSKEKWFVFILFKLMIIADLSSITKLERIKQGKNYSLRKLTTTLGNNQNQLLFGNFYFVQLVSSTDHGGWSGLECQCCEFK